MRFGPVPLAEAEGAILAHSVALPQGRLRKGCRLGPEEIATLRKLGRTEVIVARLDADDLHEDAAALAIAKALVAGPAAGLELRPVGTGRVNLHAQVTGIAGVLADRVNALNAVDPMITLATVPRWQRLSAGEMVATVKVIAYGVASTSVEAAAKAGQAALRMHPARLTRAVLIQTVTPEDDGESGHRAIQQRLQALQVEMLQPKRLVPHREADLATELQATTDADLILILTASATSDPNDVAPAALRRAGGTVERFGMPVDPGNLLFLGMLGAIPVIGLPGCARSPALNGADWVMERVICGVPVTGADIAAMGVGGLLKEIPQRGRLREAK